MQQGIRDYLNATGYNDSYYEHTELMPDFYWIEEEVERCQDVILLLGFWQAYDDQAPPEDWWRVGGHYVTCAGVNSSGMQLGISDPFFDNAGAGGPGRIPVPHPYPHNSSVVGFAKLCRWEPRDRQLPRSERESQPLAHGALSRSHVSPPC